MKLSSKQRADLDSCLYFVPGNCKDWIDSITDADIAAYFAWSDKGDRRFLDICNWTVGGNGNSTKGATAIKWGKTYRELFITDMLRDLDETVYIWELAYEEPDLPRPVLRALGDRRVRQFDNWAEIFRSDDWEATAREHALRLFPGKKGETARAVHMALFRRVTEVYRELDKEKQ
jgi:hypothetical protein